MVALNLRHGIIKTIHYITDISKSITINKMAREVLDLHNGDVIELCIDEEMISISKIN